MAKWAQNFSWSKDILEVASAYQKSAEFGSCAIALVLQHPTTDRIGMHMEFLGLVRKCTGAGEIRHRLAQLAKITTGNPIR